jgi:hypothetical protein
MRTLGDGEGRAGGKVEQRWVVREKIPSVTTWTATTRMRTSRQP